MYPNQIIWSLVSMDPKCGGILVNTLNTIVDHFQNRGPYIGTDEEANPQESKCPNTRYLPQTIRTIPNIETLNTLYFGYFGPLGTSLHNQTGT